MGTGEHRGAAFCSPARDRGGADARAYLGMGAGGGGGNSAGNSTVKSGCTKTGAARWLCPGWVPTGVLPRSSRRRLTLQILSPEQTGSRENPLRQLRKIQQKRLNRLWSCANFHLPRSGQEVQGWRHPSAKSSLPATKSSVGWRRNTHNTPNISNLSSKSVISPTKKN